MKILKTVKTVATLYFDYESGWWDLDSPKKMCDDSMRCGKDYDYMRTGTVLNVYSGREFFTDGELLDNQVVALMKRGKKRCYIVFDNMEALDMTGWFREICK